ncbi:MAG: hypothetical protein ACM3U2_17265, partial [Deltaproteobacteria bacterium]
MYLNPFRDFARKILYGGRTMRRSVRRRALSRSRHLLAQSWHTFSTAAEVCEARMMLSGPQLVQLAPNTGGTITLTSNPASATVENTAPTQLTFTFSLGAAIDQSTVTSSSIKVTRAGGDGAFGDASDVQIVTPYLQVDSSHPNQVVMRFATSLPDDLYQIQITGALKDTNNNAFNSGNTQLVDFKVDFGGQVVSVVPQPVVRSAILNVGGLNAVMTVGNQANAASRITDGDTFTITDGGATPVTFQFRDAALASQVPLGAGNVAISFNGSTSATPDSAAVIAGKIATAINLSSLSSSLTATSSGGVVTLAGQAFSPFVAKGTAANAAALTVVNNVNQITNGETFTVTAGGAPVTFQFQDVAGPVIPLGTNVGIAYNGADSASTIAADIVTAINAQAALNGSQLFGAVTATQSGSSVILTGSAFSPVATVAAANPGDLSVIGVSSTLLNVVNPAQITDHDTFAVTAGGNAVTFEFTTTGSVNTLGNVAIQYAPGDSADALVYKIVTAINNDASLTGLVTATSSGTSVVLTGEGDPGHAFRPAVSLGTANAGFLTLGVNSLTQVKNTVVVYFNQDPLDPAAAQNPAFYQVINITDGSILLPASVKYNAVANNAVLTFASDLPAGTFHLQIGAPNPSDGTIAGATNVGTLFKNPDNVSPSFTTTGFIGNKGGVSNDSSDVDLYKFQLGTGTSVTINALDIAAAFTSGVRLRLFDTSGVQISGATADNALTVGGLTAGATYYVGVSAEGNNAYDAATGSGTVSGTGTGSYKLTINTTGALSQAPDTTSFATSTNLGTLGAAGFTITSSITPLGNLAYPLLPGGNDTPGNRDLTQQGIDGESNDAGTGVGPTVPGSIPVRYYNFQDIYGTVLGAPVHNAITENQKNDARQILDMYGRYLGIKFVETASTGMIIATGDIRALKPELDPNAAGGVGGPGEVIMNANVDYGSSPYGGSWFGVAFHEIGHALGLSHSYDAPGTMGAGGESPGGTGASIEPVFPG